MKTERIRIVRPAKTELMMPAPTLASTPAASPTFAGSLPACSEILPVRSYLRSRLWRVRLFSTVRVRSAAYWGAFVARLFACSTIGGTSTPPIRTGMRITPM